MRLKTFMITAIIFAALAFNTAFAADVEVWQDPQFDFSTVKKILIMPVDAELKATKSSLKPSRRQAQDLSEWAKEGIRAAYKKDRTTLIVKSFEDVADDMSFIYSDRQNWDERAFYKRALEMGYDVFVKMAVTQEFKTEHIPESVRTYTEYREIEKRDRRGRLIEVITIPEERTEIIPAHDVTYLYTVCEPALYLTEYPNDDYVAAAACEIYREYQGGPAIQVVENIIKASTQKLFEHSGKTTGKGSKRPDTNRVIRRK